jgi:hypothetical protein
MSVETWINVSISFGTAATAFFTYRSARHAGKMIQNAARPILTITPNRSSSFESIHKPKITIQNYGQGPAIIEEIKFIGTELLWGKKEIPFSNLDTPQNFKPGEPIIVRPKEIIGPGKVLEQELQITYSQFFGEKQFVKYHVTYKDYVGSIYNCICEWNKEKEKWDHIGT